MDTVSTPLIVPELKESEYEYFGEFLEELSSDKAHHILSAEFQFKNFVCKNFVPGSKSSSGRGSL